MGRCQRIAARYDKLASFVSAQETHMSAYYIGEH